MRSFDTLDSLAAQDDDIIIPRHIERSEAESKYPLRRSGVK